MARLKMYFKGSKVTDDMKLPMLALCAIGDKAYELIVKLASPKEPSVLTKRWGI